MDKNILKRIFKYIFMGIPQYNIKVEVKPNCTGKQLLDKNIVITGGSKGIGFAIAEKCINEGANVIICGRNEQSLNSAKEKLGVKCRTLQFDLAKVDQIPDFINRTFELFNNKVDCVVNNAGISYHENSIQKVTNEGFTEQFNVNFKAVYFIAKYYIEKLEALDTIQGSNMLFLSSERGSFCEEIPYGLSKATINSLVGALGKKYIHKGMRVNAIAPGVTASDMTGHKIDGNYFSESSPSSRIFHPSEMAEVACFLLSDASSCISGEVVHCDTGKHLNKI